MRNRPAVRQTSPRGWPKVSGVDTDDEVTVVYPYP